MNNNKKPSRKKVARVLPFYIICLILTSCRMASDRSQGALDRLHIEALKEAPEKSQSPPKVFYKKKKQPSVPIPVAMKKHVSVIITEEVPLRDAFIELARQAKVDLQLGCKIIERIIFSANNRPFIEVVKDICDMAGLRYKIFGESLRIETDTPYPVHYTLPFLNLSRTSENHISIATDVFSNVKDNPSSTNNGSNSHVIGKGNNDFWTEVDGNLKIILTDRITPLPALSKEEEKRPLNYSLHRQGGIITVYGTARQHSLVTSYLESLRKMASTQVLIEAKVIEVSLKDQYKSGINWQKVAGGDFFADIGLANLAQRGRFMDPTSTRTDMLSMGLQGKTFSGILKAIEEFGASRTLSSPRLTVMNNQTAILKVAQNQVYFRLNYDKQVNLSVDRENTTVSSDIQTVPIGLVMSVHPSIDRDTGDIILSLRPTISRLTHSVSDPAVEIAFANARSLRNVEQKPSLVPVVAVEEIDSVLRLQSGEIAVLGGLMEARTTNGTTKLPLAGNLPIVGQLFTASADGDEVVELVILLRASIIDDAPPPDAADRRLYQEYVEDPRPIEMPS